ncbi:MAG: glycine--tRNA ligase subunit beta [Gammaproteobacteria bacterium]|nr:glycine--tRNA ligase subunit beta [Gammaproteobacteria bacterium]
MATPGNRPGRPKNLLIELGTEELPPKALKRLGQSFARGIFTGLVEAGVMQNKEANYRYYAAPRRLAVWARDVHPVQPDRNEERRGPAVKAAFGADGNPSNAARGFAKSCGVDVHQLKRRKTGKGEWLVYESTVKGKRLGTILTECLNEAVRALPIPRRMRWGTCEEEFIRPVHWLLVLHGSEVIRTGVLGLKAGRYSRGHRFHCPGELRILSADRYLGTLKTDGFVMADYESRQSTIVKQATRLARKAGAHAVLDAPLLEEVTGLVEWPVSVLGRYDDRFLKLPVEVLTSTMNRHQKYFHLVNGKNEPVPLFVAVSNLKSRAPARVRQGNERVLRARLSDADFFFEADQKVPLEERIDDLKEVLFHHTLGSVYDKSRRIRKLAGVIAGQLGIEGESVREAAALCKADLVTDMVGEFPELQGTMGKYYARRQGWNRKIADAIEGHYFPRHAGDQLPGSAAAQCLALADRLDTVFGIFLCGEMPTGDRDPFALRRATLGILRILVECRLDLDLLDLYRQASTLYVHVEVAGNREPGLEPVIELVLAFSDERLKGYFIAQGFDAEAIAAVLAGRPTRPFNSYLRLKAVSELFTTDRTIAESLAYSNKRIANILSKAGRSHPDSMDLDSGLLTEPAEKALAESVERIEEQVFDCFENEDYDRGFNRLSALGAPIDTFFDQVMVMHDDPAVRANRLALLARIRRLFLGGADLSKMRLEP